jgi:hypothetical protein
MSKEVISQAQLAGVDWSSLERGKPAMDYDLGAWAGRPDITYHASKEHPMPYEEQPGEMSYDIRHEHGFGGGFHSGTQQAAMERAHVMRDRAWAGDVVNTTLQGKDTRNFIHPVRMTGDYALPQTDTTYSGKMVFTDAEANESAKIPVYSDRVLKTPSMAEVQMRKGRHVPYENTAEDYGSISFRSPREKLRTWSEDVLADPNASRQHRLLAEQFDLTVPVRENAADIVKHQEQHWAEKHPMQGEEHQTAGAGLPYEQPSLLPGEPSEFLGHSSAALMMSPRLKRKW